MTDVGRAAVAAAEDMAFGGTDVDLPLDRDSADRHLERVTGGPWWREACARAVTSSAPRAGTKSSSARHDGRSVDVRLADGQLTLGTIAHELAHALAGIERGHDARFRAAYVDVVVVVAGAGDAAALGDAFAWMGLDVDERCWPPPYRASGDGFVVISA